MPREILVEWVAPGGTGFRTVTYWDPNSLVADQRAALGTLLGAIDFYLDNGVTWLVQTSGRTLADDTGTLTGSWTENTTQAGTGAATGDTVPDAAQMLLRWNGSDIVDGRFIRGRNFLPGVSTQYVTEGNVNAAARTAISGFVSTFASANKGFGIWHRPKNGSGGLFSDVSGGSVWQEFAVLRRRRN